MNTKAIAAALMMAGCGGSSPASHSASEGSGVAATRGVDDELQRLPPVLRERFSSTEGRRELERTMTDRALLVAEARRRGFAQAPEVRAQVEALEERLMLAQLLASEESLAGEPADAELRRWYEAHKAELASPERLRFSRVLVAVGPAATAVERERARRRAETLRARVLKGEAFPRVAKDGDGAEKATGGDIGLAARGDWKDSAAELAAFSLHDPGSISPVTSCRDGWAFFRLEERRPATMPSFDEARNDVVARIGPERKRRVFDALVARLRGGNDGRSDVAVR